MDLTCLSPSPLPFEFPLPALYDLSYIWAFTSLDIPGPVSDIRRLTVGPIRFNETFTHPASVYLTELPMRLFTNDSILDGSAKTLTPSSMSNYNLRPFASAFGRISAAHFATMRETFAGSVAFGTFPV